VLRCHAEVCEKDGGASQLGGFFRAGLNPVPATAQRLYAREMVSKVEDPEEWVEERLMDEFDEVSREDPDRLGFWMKLARSLLDVIPRGSNAYHLRKVLSADYGIEVSPAEAERYTRLLESTLRDLSWMVSVDVTFQIIEKKLGCSRGELVDALPPGTDESSLAALRNVIAGEKDDPRAIARLRAVCADDDWKARLDTPKGDPDLYRDLFSDHAVSPTGRVRCGVYVTRARAATHLDLADDATKAVLFALVAAGFDLVGWDGEEFAVQVREGADLSAAAEAVKQEAERAARRVVRIFDPVAEVRPASAW
jgi:hypothetical protein